MKYLDFYELERRPFVIPPDIDFLYWTDKHKITFDALRHEVLSSAPFTLLTGEIGAGKTLLTHALSHDADVKSKFNLCEISAQQGNTTVILQQLVSEFHGSSDAEDQWGEVCRAAENLRASGRPPLIVVDEAQHASADCAEILGQLVTGVGGQIQPVQVLLVGQPELKRIIRQPKFNLLRSALGVSVHLDALTPTEVQQYVRFRLHAAGAPEGSDIFEPETLALIHATTNGVPRLINKLCEICLFLGHQMALKSISENVLRVFLESYVDPNTLSLSGSFTERETPANVVVPTEPARRFKPKPEPESERPVHIVDAIRKRSVQERNIQSAKKSGFAKAWGIGGVVVASVVYIASPIGPLSEENPVMVALYGAPDIAQSIPTIAPQELSPLLQMERAFDRSKDPADLYFNDAIEQTDKQQIAMSYTRAAIRGHERGALYLSQLYQTGDGVAFAPDVGARWYAVAEDATLLDNVNIGGSPVDGGDASPLFSNVQDGIAEFIWQGKASLFQLEIGDNNGTTIATFTTPLTAALVTLPEGGTQWRLRTSDTTTTDWNPVNALQQN